MSGAETAALYRLSGEKKLLQQMQKEHQNDVLDVTGRLRSDPNSSSVARSTQVGKARVFVGAGKAGVVRVHADGFLPDAARALIRSRPAWL